MPVIYPLKRSIIREELRDLTGNGAAAALLDQLLQWYQVDCHWSHWMLAHKMAAAREGVSPPHGDMTNPPDHWIPLSAVDLAESLMMDVDEADIEKHIAHFKTRGWIEIIHYPHDIPRFRCCPSQIQADLETLGYSLHGFYDLSAWAARRGGKDGSDAVRSGHINL